MQTDARFRLLAQHPESGRALTTTAHATLRSTSAMTDVDERSETNDASASTTGAQSYRATEARNDPASTVGARTVGEVKDALGWSTYQWRLFCITGLCIMAEGIEVNLLSFLEIECQKEWGLSEKRTGDIASGVFAGEIAGCVLFGLFADMYGRKPAFALGILLVTVFGVLSAFSRSVEEMILYGFGLGLGIGGFSVPYDLLCEFCPNSARGVVMMALWTWWTLGSFMVLQLASVTLAKQGWRTMCVYCAIPPIISTLGLFWVDESPTWLLVKGRKKEAEAILKRAAKTNGIDIGELELVEEKEHPLDVRLLFKGDNALRTLLVWVVSFAQTFLYYGTVLYLPRVFLVLMTDGRDASLADDDVEYPYWALCASIGGELLGNILAMTLVQRYARSSLTAFFFGLYAVAFPIIIAPVSDVVMVIAAMASRLSASVAGNMTWLIAPEAYPTEIRATGHSWANMLARLGAFATTHWVTSTQDTQVLFAGYSVVAIVAAFAAAALPPGQMSGSTVSKIKDA